LRTGFQDAGDRSVRHWKSLCSADEARRSCAIGIGDHGRDGVA
jgi:hypothetical protein